MTPATLFTIPSKDFGSMFLLSFALNRSRICKVLKPSLKPIGWHSWLASVLSPKSFALVWCINFMCKLRLRVIVPLCPSNFKVGTSVMQWNKRFNIAHYLNSAVISDFVILKKTDHQNMFGKLKTVLLFLQLLVLLLLPRAFGSTVIQFLFVGFLKWMQSLIFIYLFGI